MRKYARKNSGTALGLPLVAAGLAWMAQPASSASSTSEQRFETFVGPEESAAPAAELQVGERRLPADDALTLAGLADEHLLEMFERGASGDGPPLADSQTKAIDAELAGGDWEGLRGESLPEAGVESLQGLFIATESLQGNTVLLAQASQAGTVSDSQSSKPTASGTSSDPDGLAQLPALFALGAVALVAAASGEDSSISDGGGNGDGGGGGDGGLISDGYISGARVFRDLDGDGLWDEDEPWVTSNSKGEFSGLTGSGGTIIAVGGTDISTGLAFEGVLKAPEGSTTINPITTLVAALTSNGMSVEDAEARIASLLGIDLDDVGSLLTTDPISLASSEEGSGSHLGVDMQLLALQAANLLVTLTQTLLESGVAGSAEEASSFLSSALNNVLSGATSLNLASTNFIESLFQEAADAALAAGASSADLVKFNALSESVSAAISSVNAYTQSINPTQGLDAITIAVAAQLTIVGSGGLLDKIGAAASNPYASGALNEIISATQNMSSLVDGRLDEVRDITGDGTNAGDNPPDPIINPTLTLDSSVKSEFYGVVDGTISLNSSLAALNSLGIEAIQGSSGQESVLVSDGFGTANLASLAGLSFASGLDVTLVVDEAADSDLTPDGTITLNTSLKGLSDLGIDHITGQGSGVLVSDGFGTANLASLAGLSFASGLDVTLVVDEAADSDLTPDGTITLNTSLKGLSDLGIDHITGQGSVLIADGLGVNDLAELNPDLAFADSGAADLDVALDISGNADSTISLSSTLQDLADLGIDLIRGTADQAIALAGLGTSSLTNLGGEDGFGFAKNLDVSLYIDTDAELGDLLDALDVETTGDETVADFNSTQLLDSLTNGEAGAAKLGELGIDHIVIGGDLTADFDDDDGWTT